MHEKTLKKIPSGSVPLRDWAGNGGRVFTEASLADSARKVTQAAYKVTPGSPDSIWNFRHRFDGDHQRHGRWPGWIYLPVVRIVVPRTCACDL